MAVTALALHRPTRRLFAGTLGRGVYFTYTSGIRSLRVTAISHTIKYRKYPGIQWLRLTDGSRTWEESRLDVIRRIEAGSGVHTVGADGSRAEVLVMPPDTEHPIDYLRTVPDATKADNLLSLPEFYR